MLSDSMEKLGVPLDQNMSDEALCQIDAITDNSAAAATRAWNYVPGAGPREFCLELAPGEVLTQGGEPVVMGFDQVKLMEEFLKRGNWPPPKDIFRHLHIWKPAPRVQVLGPGPNGQANWHKLGDYPTIVVNKAVDIPDVRKDIWLTSEGTAHLTNWFKYGIEHHYDISCMSNSDLSLFYPDGPWTHELGRNFRECAMMTRGDVKPTPLLLRGGATITSMAIHLAYWMGAREIVLCGVDMGDNIYYNYDPRMPLGSKEHEVAEFKAGMYKDFSKYVPLMQELCDWLKDDGIKVSTLSETALNVETENLQARELWRP